MAVFFAPFKDGWKKESFKLLSANLECCTVENSKYSLTDVLIRIYWSAINEGIGVLDVRSGSLSIIRVKSPKVIVLLSWLAKYRVSIPLCLIMMKRSLLPLIQV